MVEMNNTFGRVSAPNKASDVPLGAQEDRIIFLLFSPRDNISPLQESTVIDENGKRKTVRFTYMSSEATPSNYKWPETREVWSGPASKLTVLGEAERAAPRTGITLSGAKPPSR